jgi:hypothetical protein
MARVVVHGGPIARRKRCYSLRAYCSRPALLFTGRAVHPRRALLVTGSAVTYSEFCYFGERYYLWQIMLFIMSFIIHGECRYLWRALLFIASISIYRAH